MKNFFKDFNKKTEVIKKNFLLTDKHPNRDFFIADIFDGIPFKDDIASMEHPIFSLSTKKDLRVIKYGHNDNNITISPSLQFGLPTIFDKDVLLYCGSLLMAKKNNKTIPPKTLRISSHDLLVATNRTNDGRGYRLLKKALERLQGVSITTNIKTNGKQQSAGFGLIDTYKIVESSRVKDRMVKLEITLSDWFYNSIMGDEVLQIDPQYFFLRQPLERRIYEIARKHCGSQNVFKISIELLHKKTGSTSTLSKFRFNLKKIIERNTIPEYFIYLENDDNISFKRMKSKEKAKQLELALTSTTTPSIFFKDETLEKARKLVLEAKTGWDLYAIKDEFLGFNEGKTNIKNIDGLFIGFVKKKIVKCP